MKYILYFVAGVLVGFILGKLSSNSNQQAKNSEPYLPPGEAASDEKIKQLAKNGGMIMAIKLYRQAHGCGLKEAKEAVEKLSQS